MKAYLISAIQRKKQQLPASTPDSPSVVDLDEKEFRRLEAMGAVRKPSDRELKMASLANVEDAEEVDEADESEEAEDYLAEIDGMDADALREEFERVFDKKPGNMGEETMRERLKAHATADDNLGV